jgi:thiamine-phosphate pyrophosphorylase
MDARLRIIDANANRAREALRVLEDIARFGLDDAALSEDLKTARHDLRDALDGLGIDKGALVANRDVGGDVGTTFSTPAELKRSGLREVGLAAASRLGEALRSIEECAKALATESKPFEALRYRVYDLEKRLILALGAGTCPQWRLCVLITGSLCSPHPWDKVAAEAISGGADCLQLREKELSAREFLARARRLVAIAREVAGGGTDVRGRASIVVNDRPDIAVLAGADGVHLGQSDLPVADVRSVAGFDLWTGVSTADIPQALAAVREGADMCGLGPMFQTTTARDKARISGPQYLRQYLADPVLSSRPHLAIGGITPENIDLIAAAGGQGVAVSSCVCNSEDPAAVCEALRRGLE